MTEITPEQKEQIEAEVAERLEGELRTTLEEEFRNKFTSENKELLDAAVDERLSKMKGNVDKAYGKVDELTAKLTRLQEERKEEQRKRMEEEGKHLELSQMQVTEYKEKNKILEEKVLNLTRDQEVKDLLSGQEFRNDYARGVAFDSIVRNLVQDEERGWIHKSGASLQEYFAVFAKDPNHEILFKQKDNSGTGTPRPGDKGKITGKSLKEMTTAEMLEAAASGQLGDVPMI